MTKIHDITKQALAGDLNWVPGEGFIVVWKMIATRGARAGEPVSYVWGYGPCSKAKKKSGWGSAKDGEVYATYAEAAAQLPLILDHDPFWDFSERDVRIVKVRIQRPVVILDDMPADLLQRLAEI
jgi:hypothetical protein